MHYFQFNIGDYASHTRHLTLMEDLAYRRLLDLYYLSEEPIAGDAQEIARKIGMRDQVEEVGQVLADFFELERDCWANSRADAEIADYKAFLEKQRQNGKRGGRPAKNPQKPTANPSLTQSEPKKSLTTNQQPLTNNQDIVICASEDARLDPVEEKVSHPPVEDVMEYWNELADKIGKQRIRKLSASRRQLVKARLREYSIDEFVEMFDNIERSKFLREWKALGFDWVMKAGNFQKVLEGNYSD